MPNTQSPPSTKTPIAAGVEAIPQGAIAPAPDLPTDHPDGDILGQRSGSLDRLDALIDDIHVAHVVGPEECPDAGGPRALDL